MLNAQKFASCKTWLKHTGWSSNSSCWNRSPCQDSKTEKTDCSGRNKVSYKEICYSNTDMKISHQGIAKWIETQDIPSSWKSYNTTMNLKPMEQGHYNEISSWRPIVLLDSSYKIYKTALCNQLRKWWNINNLLDPMQKSLGLADDCAELNFALRSLLEHYCDSLKSSISIRFLDIEEAFPSINISVMLTILKKMRLSLATINIIWSLYLNCNSTLLCGGYTYYLPSLSTTRCPARLPYNHAVIIYHY